MNSFLGICESKCESFMAAVDSFDGAAITAIHNEMFLHGLANRFIVFQKDSIIVQIGWEEEDTGPVKKKSEVVVNKKEARKIRSDFISRRSNELKPLENEIMEREETLKSLHHDLAEASTQGDSSVITKLSKKEL